MHKMPASRSRNRLTHRYLYYLHQNTSEKHPHTSRITAFAHRRSRTISGFSSKGLLRLSATTTVGVPRIMWPTLASKAWTAACRWLAELADCAPRRIPLSGGGHMSPQGPFLTLRDASALVRCGSRDPLGTATGDRRGRALHRQPGGGGSAVAA